MATQRPRTGNRLATRTEQAPIAKKLPARRFPIQCSIQQLSNDLDALNERIIELENEGHRGHAMDVLKANAMDFARRIDELRSILVVVPAKKGSCPSCCIASTIKGVPCLDHQGKAARPSNSCATPIPTFRTSSRPCANTGCRPATVARADHSRCGSSCRLRLFAVRST